MSCFWSSATKSDACAMPSTRTGLSVNSRGALQRREDHRRRAVADQRAIVDVERVGDRFALHRLLQRDRLAHVRVGIERAVGVVLHRDRGQMLLLRPEIVHVPARDHGEQRRKGVAGLASRPSNRPASRQDLAGPRGGLRGHLLHPDHHHDVVDPRRDFRTTRGKTPSRSTRRRLPRASDGVPTIQSGRNVRRKMVLPDKCRPREVPKKKESTCPGAYARFRAPSARPRPRAERRSRSGKTPKGVLPMPITATGLI